MKPTVAWQLFNTPFLCEIPEHFFHTVDMLKIYGMRSSGDRALDRELMLTWRPSYMTIVQMATFFNEGAPVRLKRISDAPVISDIVERHLNNWLIVVTETYLCNNVPVEDLMLLDQFYTSCAKISKAVVDKKPVRDNILSKFSMGIFNNQGISIFAGMKGRLSHLRQQSSFNPATDTPETLSEKIAKAVFAREMNG